MTYKDHEGVPFERGAAAVANLLRRSGLSPTAEQAMKLWQEVRPCFETDNGIWAEELQEMLEAENGNLDTLVRDDLRGALARTLTGMHWPINNDSNQVAQKFASAFSKAMIDRGIVTVEEV